MSDIAFWKLDWWRKVVERIAENKQHTFLFLTKQPDVYYSHALPMNCWLGVTVTNANELTTYQDHLAFFKNLCFLSVEPLLEKIDPALVDTEYVQWVILAAESGNRKEKVVPPPEWIAPWLDLSLPLYMKHNLPWNGIWRREYPV